MIHTDSRTALDAPYEAASRVLDTIKLDEVGRKAATEALNRFIKWHVARFTIDTDLEGEAFTAAVRTTMSEASDDVALLYENEDPTPGGGRTAMIYTFAFKPLFSSEEAPNEQKSKD